MRSPSTESESGGRFSSNERWICFRGVSTTDEGDTRIYVVPVAGGEWTPITDARKQK